MKRLELLAVLLGVSLFASWIGIAMGDQCYQDIRCDAEWLCAGGPFGGWDITESEPGEWIEDCMLNSHLGINVDQCGTINFIYSCCYVDTFYTECFGNPQSEPFRVCVVKYLKCFEPE